MTGGWGAAGDDDFGTAALRAAVLGAWRASPARLREDANAEEDHARGYYRDRVLVELAQNAADAAVRAAVPGRLLLRVARDPDGGAVLVAANTGAPLDAAGVASLATLRASAKRDGHGVGLVGRFGVGFAAVRAVADEVAVCSTSGAVRFSLADTRAALEQASADVPALAEEVRRRDGSLPALRLPWPATGRPPGGYDTAVVLTLRDEVALDEVRALLAEVGDALLLALPGLVEVVVEDVDAPSRRVADVGRRWRVRTAHGEVPLAAVADRPVEERAARAWRVTWALPRPGAPVDAVGGPGPAGGRWSPVVHAPTPTDEPCTLPGLLVATLPLDPARRHVVRGPLTDVVLAAAADTWAALARDVATDGGDALALVPTGLADGWLDGELRAAAVEAMARTPLLAPAVGDELVAPARATAVRDLTDDAALAVLGALVAGMVRVPPGGAAAARTLGVEERGLADLVEELPATAGLDWAGLYDALDAVGHDARVREQLAALPVPLLDGRVVRGPRGTVVLDGALVAALDPQTLGTLRAWGLRVVDPAAAHPLLGRLGAQTLDGAALLAHPAVRQAVLGQADDDDLDRAADVTATVLDLVAGLPTGPDGVPGLPADAASWLGLLTLPAADGEPTPAHGLVLPGSVAADLLDPRVVAPVAEAAVDRWGPGALLAVGVRADLVVTPVPDVVAGVGPDDDGDDPAALAAASLDGWTEYLDDLADLLGDGTYVGDLVAVADLDAVDEDAWPAVLAHVAADPRLRSALLTPVRGEQTGATAPSYTAWWVRTRAELPVPGVFALPGAEGLPAQLVPPVPAVLAGLDAGALRALGGAGSLDELPPADWPHVLDRVGRPGARVPLDVAAALWRAWAAGALPADPPASVVALAGAGAVVVDAEDAVVADGPQWWQRTDLGPVVPVPPAGPGGAGGSGAAARLAAGLDLPLASAACAGAVDGQGEVEPVPDDVAALLPGAPATWWRHDELRVDGVEVEWWVEGSGPGAVVHAVHVAGLAAGLAVAAGRWHLRAALEALLAGDGGPDAVLDVALG